MAAGKIPVRFTWVCKSWKLIISNPEFVKLHLCRSSSNAANLAYTPLLYDLYNACRGPVPLLFSSQNQKGYDLYPIEKGYDLIGVCQIRRHYAEEITSIRVRLWNPATRLQSQVSPPLNLIGYTYIRSYGFGYDYLNDTYKTVAVVGLNYRTREPEHEEWAVKVYNRGGSCWRNIQSFPVPLSGVSPQYGVYVSGTLNWIVMINNGFIVVSLDLGREDYSQFSLPDFAQLVVEFPHLGILNGRLCVLQYDGNTSFTIWQMEELGTHKSWTQLFKFDFEEYVFQWIPRFVLSEKDGVLLISSNNQVLYNLRDNTFKITGNYIGVFNNDRHIGGGNAENHVESLVSPG